MVNCLERGADCLHMVQLLPVHPKIPASLASFKFRLVLPFWYQLTQVVLEKRPLNGCNNSSSSSSSSSFQVNMDYQREIWTPHLIHSTLCLCEFAFQTGSLAVQLLLHNTLCAQHIDHTQCDVSSSGPHLALYADDVT